MENVNNNNEEELKIPRYHAVIVEDINVNNFYPFGSSSPSRAKTYVISEHTQANLKKKLSEINPDFVRGIFRGKKMDIKVKHDWSLS